MNHTDRHLTASQSNNRLKPHSGGALSLDALEQQFSAITEQGQQHFDPVRFSFISALLRRTKNTQPAASTAVLQQLAKHLSDYQQHFWQAQQQAQQHCQMIEQQCTALAFESAAAQSLINTARQQFEQQQFQALARLHRQLSRQQQRQQQTSHGALQHLSQSLLQSHNPEAQQPTSALDQQLQQHEAAASAALITNSNEASSATNTPFNNHQVSGELKSIALFRASWAKRHIDELANQAINNRPDNAGPLNPERLASGSLSRIKALSPRYLQRFIAYADTLLWLQQTEQQHSKAIKKIKNKSTTEDLSSAAFADGIGQGLKGL